MQYYVVYISVKPEPSRVKLGKAIRTRRKLLHVSQEKMAEHIDCHRNYVGLVERGRQNLTVDMLCRFAKGFKCTVAQLMQEAGL